VSRIRLYPMTPALRTYLTELVDDRGIKGYRALSDRTGGEISHETVRRILTGQVLRIRYDTLVALADALHAPIAELIGMSLGADTAGPWILGAAFDDMPHDKRPSTERALLALLRGLDILPPPRSADQD
jgi:DNA-binding Xre family transcriptional regulator